MAGYIIHIATGKAMLNLAKKKNKPLIKEKDYKEFLNGIIMPDYKNKSLKKLKLSEETNPWNITHSFDMNKDFKELTPYELGYFVHLLTDNYFYKIYDNCGPLYEDYNYLNNALIKKYNLELPDLIKDDIKFKDGAPKILEIDEICKFIDEMANLNLKKEYKKFKKTEMNCKYISNMKETK